MNIPPLLDQLNDAQREAVTASDNHLRVLAGAGSGKTRVLVHRIAWLIQHDGLSPLGILAVTFTNKAAREMRSRLEEMLRIPLYQMWVGTFHGLAHRFLRTHWQAAGLPQAFQILDAEDQFRLVKRIHKSLNLDEERWPPRQSQWFINTKKDEGLRAADLASSMDFATEKLVRVYEAYEELCQQSGLVDFAELLLRTHELLAKDKTLLEHYQQRFSHLLVDEFQDTNTIQYAWLRLLAGPNAHITIVGDDDQSIYGWRGAQIENIHRFDRDFPNTKTIRLEQNYRSTGNILAAANAVISNNNDRLGKQLWTKSSNGAPISVYNAFNEVDEARFIANTIDHWTREGHPRRECAVLYRSNAQSRALEEGLIRAGIPYHIYGGQRFFERAEIKDALAYLRLLSNRDDDAAFERIVNRPTRGIGNTTLQQLRQTARLNSQSLWQAANHLLHAPEKPSRTINALGAFIALIEGLDKDTKGLELPEQIQHVVECSGLKAHFQKDRTEKGRTRLENLDELISAAQEFVLEPNTEDTLSPLNAFLVHAALEAGEHQGDMHEDCVQLMTMHSAKGLEFSLVVISGVEEGLFPHIMSMNDPNGLEEERRLCYVGMTRARQKLYMSHAETRRLHGSETYQRPSRFLKEIPKELIEGIRLDIQVARPITPKSKPIQTHYPIADTGFQVGQTVSHKKFGKGVIVNYEGQGAHARVQVKFPRIGTKWLIASYLD